MLRIKQEMKAIKEGNYLKLTTRKNAVYDIKISAIEKCVSKEDVFIIHLKNGSALGISRVTEKPYTVLA